MIPGILVAFRTQKSVLVLLVILGLCSTITSVLLWQQNYTVGHYGHWDADRYGLYAQKLANYAADQQQREAIHKWFGSYPHLHNALAPTVVAVPIYLGADRDSAYLVFMSICGFMGLLLFFRILNKRLGLSYRTSLVAVIFFGCHLLQLRSFSRAVTDELGLVLTLWTLDLLLARLETVIISETVSLAVLMFLHPLARPQGFVYLPFILAGVLFCDWWRTRQLHFKDMALTVTKLLVVPAIAIVFLYLIFDWFHNFQLSIEKAKIFQRFFTFRYFISSMIGLCQLLPVLWLIVRKQRLVNPSTIILVAFGICYLAMLTIVKAPLWLRHFLPILPVAVCLGALGLEDIQSRVKKNTAMAIALAISAANVALIIYQILLTERIPSAIRNFISSG
ncbi:MAG: hypothetical protein JRJ87_25905 [Deltaproteobacteria bacterium]|nr:hypothetical protein [Deltaproteobacteria bacterium]